MVKSKICLREYVKEGCIFEFEETDKDKLLKGMAERLKDLGFIKDDSGVEDVYRKLVEREKLGSTGIIKYIAIPHCKTDAINTEMVILVGYSKKGIDFQSHDGKPVHIVFGVFTQKSNVTLHLAALAAISRLISKHSIFAKIDEFLSKEKLWEIIEECEYEI